MTTFLSQLRPAFTLLGAFALVLGLAYPLAITGIAQAVFPAQAGGSLIRRGDTIVGSALIGQAFSADRYVQGRPSATDPAYNAASSGGSNLGPSSAVLLAEVAARANALGDAPVPSELATASASGLDPHMTLAAALGQVPRIAQSRGLGADAVGAAIRAATTGPAFGLLGAPIVNVLQANLALDALEG